MSRFNRIPPYSPIAGLPSIRKGRTDGVIPQFEDDLSGSYLSQSSNLIALVVLTQAEFNALSPPDPQTMYFING